MKSNSPFLTITDGKFVLICDVNTGRVPTDPEWTFKSPRIYETTSLRAAIPFRAYSSADAKKILNRALQAHYEAPKLPWLPLDSHQWAGVNWILSRKRSYLAHAPGAGKTIEALIAALFTRGPGQILFVVPPSLTLNWKREIERFADDWDLRVPGGWSASIVPLSPEQKEMNWDSYIIICPDSMLTKPWVYTALVRLKPKFIAVDEASRFKEATEQRSIAFYGGVAGTKRYPGLFKNARHVVFLDGSPMPNRPMELWAPTYALHPEAIDCMGMQDFGFRYCGAKMNDFGQWEFKHSKNEAELKERLRKDFMHVVTEEELTHPERRRSMVFLNRDVRSSEQKTWERRHLDQIIQTGITEEASQGDLARFRRELGLKKIPWIVSYVMERLENKREQILLFAWHCEVVEQLTELLHGYKRALVMGGTDAASRETAFSQFQEGRIQIIIGNIAAMGRGHNLQNADRVIFAEFSWTDELNKQCEKRASRRGSEKEFVRCEYLVAPDSMDERVLKSVFTKESRVGEIIG